MPHHSHSKKLRRFFTEQPLQSESQELRLTPSETRHLRDSIRLKPGDACLVTDGQGQEAEAVICEFSRDDCARLRVTSLAPKPKAVSSGLKLCVMPALLQKGKTDFVMEKAQELGVDEIRPIFSDYCEIKITQEKKEKMIDRWNRIAREASKQSGSLTVLRVLEPLDFKEAIAGIPLDESITIFHPGANSVPFPQWLEAIQKLKTAKKMTRLNLFIGPEGGFSDDEIAWVRWKRNEKQHTLVNLGEVLFKADTAFVGIVAALRFSGILS